jgi:hypothetical protein
MAVEMSDAEKLARAVLMFYQGVTWGENERETWLMLTGSEEATTRTLGNLARKVRAQEEMRTT